MNSWRVVEGDALERLRELEDGSVQTCVTSPPYFGLRDYGTSSWEGGDEGCDHAEVVNTRRTFYANNVPGPAGSTGKNAPMRNETKEVGGECASCGARRIDNQVGLESTPDEYVARLVEVFREVRRVLRDDGTVWLNLGDSYAATHHGKGGESRSEAFNDPGDAWRDNVVNERRGRGVPEGVKPKDLLGIPWMVAFALRADGWYLRSDIIWAKPNPMPESVTDRPTKAHEYVFLLSKSPRYFYDGDAVREEPAREWDGEPPQPLNERDPQRLRVPGNTPNRVSSNGWGNSSAGRNKRSVWTVATAPFPGAHFAVFPPKLVEPCVLAGSAETACGVCGAPWERVVARMPNNDGYVNGPGGTKRFDVPHASGGATVEGVSTLDTVARYDVRTVGWEPTCDHQDDTGTSTVLDPFAGAGTTGLVATRHNRSFIGIELNPEYAEMARDRIRDDAPLMNYIIEG